MRVFCVACLSIVSLTAQTSPLTPGEQHGRRIYLAGQNLSGVLGGSGTALSGREAACGNCHGQDGTGNPEGGTKPSVLLWQELTKPNREHPYNEALVQRAITTGVDSGGKELQAVMPRFRMESGDMADLISYLRKLGTIADPGVTADTVRIGLVFPPGQRSGPAAAAIGAALKAYFEDLNQAGGIYHRRVDLRVARDGESTNDFIAREQIFALVASYAAGSETSIPVVGAIASDPEFETQPGRNIFYLYPGLTGQARALLTYAAQAHATTAIVFEDEAMRPVADRLARVGESPSSPDAVVFLALGRVTMKLGATGRTFVSYPALPSEESPDATAQYQKLASRYQLPSGQLAAQWTALASAAILTEGLKRSGNDPTREKLVTALEGFYEFRTGYTHAVTYGRSRHIGAQGAYVVETSGATQAFRVCGWIQEDSGN